MSTQSSETTFCQEADEQVQKEYRCSYCGGILMDHEIHIQPCPMCDEWHWLVFK